MPVRLLPVDAFLVVDLVRFERTSPKAKAEYEDDFVTNLVGSALLRSSADPTQSFDDVTIRWKKASDVFALPERKQEDPIPSQQIKDNSLLVVCFTDEIPKRLFVIACDDQHEIKLRGAITVASATAELRVVLDPAILVRDLDVANIPGDGVVISDKSGNPTIRQLYGVFLDALKARTGR